MRSVIGRVIVGQVMSLALLVAALVAPASPAAAQGGAFGIGLPFAGHYDRYELADPATHFATDGSDWATDLFARDAEVRVAVVDASGALSLEVVDARPGLPCGIGGSSADVGGTVTVAVSVDGERLADLTYLHLARIPAGVLAGGPIEPDAVVGRTVASFDAIAASPCWQVPLNDGVHIHFTVRPQGANGCYMQDNRGGAGLSARTVIGMVGARYASGPRQACTADPAGGPGTAVGGAGTAAGGADTAVGEAGTAVGGAPVPVAGTVEPGAGAPARSVQRLRLSGPDRQATSVAVAAHAFPSGASTVYLAHESQGLALALAAGTVTDGPVLLVPGSGAAPAVLMDAVRQLAPSRVVVLGGPADGVGEDVAVGLAQGRPRERIAGQDVAATAVRIALRAWPDGARRVYLAEPERLADGLAGGTLRDGPILLVPPGGPLPASVTAAVQTLRPDLVVALGGTGAVSDAVLGAASGTVPSARLSGASRFETAVAISAQTFADGASTVYLARHDIAPDAVVAGSVTDGPILLAQPCGPDGSVPPLHPATAAEIARLAPARVVALGGTAALCDALLEAAAAIG